MRKLKPWYQVVTPREDLRTGIPLDAAEFAVHLDQIRDGRAKSVYQNPNEFFERTYLTKNLIDLSSEVIRRLSIKDSSSSAIYNMSTQFGGGKTHTLTLLYHLATLGSKAGSYAGVNKILTHAQIKDIPEAKTAVFVGTEFDSLRGRGGQNGEPLRKTPWGEIAYQLGGPEAFNVVKLHDEQMTAPAGDVIRQFLPKDKPILILMDEIMNFISRSRKSGMATQFYNFLQALSEEMRAQNHAVMVIAIPASELEMTTEDVESFEQIKKLLDRLGKAVIMSERQEVAEIIRRRLFEWDTRILTDRGTIHLSQDATDTCVGYSEWITDHRQQLATDFPIDHSLEQLKSTYPFHPTVISVFERKWQSLPRFQQTRGVLRLLALWVSKAYQQGYKGAHKDPLITLGTAPLDDAFFRAAVLEQLGEPKLENVITTDICGKNDSHAEVLDNNSQEVIKKHTLHKKVAITIFFESNGGTNRNAATLPEIRIAIGEPDIDIGNIETVKDNLLTTSFFLESSRDTYRYRLTPNINKILVDRKATINDDDIKKYLKDKVKDVFVQGKISGIDLVLFPEKSSHITDKPIVTFVVCEPEKSVAGNGETLKELESFTREYGSTSRQYKNALIWCVADSHHEMTDIARLILALESINEEKDDLRLDEGQQDQIDTYLHKETSRLKESIWRSYKNIFLLSKENGLKKIDLGLIHSSSADSILRLLIDKLKQVDELSDGINSRQLIRNWPPAFTEWSTKNIRDAIYASPVFYRLVNQDTLKDTIARGVESGDFAYVTKNGNSFGLFRFKESINPVEIEISDDTYIIQSDVAVQHVDRTQQPLIASGKPANQSSDVTPPNDALVHDIPALPNDNQVSQTDNLSKITWSGKISHQQWMLFYREVLSKYVLNCNLDVRVNFVADSVSSQKIQETRNALAKLGLTNEIKTE